MGVEIISPLEGNLTYEQNAFHFTTKSLENLDCLYRFIYKCIKLKEKDIFIDRVLEYMFPKFDSRHIFEEGLAIVLPLLI